MRYRPLGPSGVLVSELSFGCGHLPEDAAASTGALRAGIAAGCNYFETAECYLNGQCQQKTALGVRGFTDKVMVSAKEGVGPETTADSYRKDFERQLSNLGVDRVEWLQVGWMSLELLPVLTRKGGALETIHQLMSEGLVGHLGFTGHDTPENVIELLKTGIFESTTVSYHLLNRTYEPAIAYAGRHGYGVVVMNPVGGGILGTPAPDFLHAIPGGAVTSLASVALRFVLANPHVSTACSGMSSEKMVAENVAAVEQAAGLSTDDREKMGQILDQFKALGDRFCTGCRYCMPCPRGVDIPNCFRLYNLHTVYGFRQGAREIYDRMNAEQRASTCARCGECEAKCPNKLPIMEQLEAVRGLFAQELVA
ncbi:MAG: aldo/keto reductase [Armatimonadota bacterium]